MFIERKKNEKTGEIEFWKANWQSGPPAKKIFIEKVCNEADVPIAKCFDAKNTFAVCWADDRTMGNIAVSSPEMMGIFQEKEGINAILPCEFVSAGKFRNGLTRLWCRTHQKHWGIKADTEALKNSNEMNCSNHFQGMNYVVDPKTINVEDYAEVGIWCSLPAALSSTHIKTRKPRIHVHLRGKAEGKKEVDDDFSAISLIYDNKLELFSSDAIQQVNITPPAALEFVIGLEKKKEMECINCSTCGFPHLDMGSFAEKPHRKHFCAACGRDSTWSKKPIVSTPLKPLHDCFLSNTEQISPDRKLNLDEYTTDHEFRVWASTPAVIWTADRPQEVGIHVHVGREGNRIIDDTFSEVTYKGELLSREDLFNIMLENAT